MHACLEAIYYVVCDFEKKKKKKKEYGYTESFERWKEKKALSFLHPFANSCLLLHGGAVTIWSTKLFDSCYLSATRQGVIVFVIVVVVVAKLCGKPWRRSPAVRLCPTQHRGLNIDSIYVCRQRFDQTWITQADPSTGNKPALARKSKEYAGRGVDLQLLMLLYMIFFSLSAKCYLPAAERGCI